MKAALTAILIGMSLAVLDANADYSKLPSPSNCEEILWFGEIPAKNPFASIFTGKAAKAAQAKEEKNRIEASLGPIVRKINSLWRDMIHTQGLSRDDLVSRDFVAAAVGVENAIEFNLKGRFKPMALTVFSGKWFADRNLILEDEAGYVGYLSSEATMFVSLSDLRSNATADLNKLETWALVIAHEMGHHLQSLLLVGLIKDGAFSRHKEVDTLYEWQADCLAGVVLSHMKDAFTLIEVENMRKSILAGGTKLHGKGSTRLDWFDTGFRAGSPSACNTFAEVRLR